MLFSYLFTCLKGKEISAGRAVSGFKSYGRVVVQNEKIISPYSSDLTMENFTGNSHVFKLKVVLRV